MLQSGVRICRAASAECNQPGDTAAAAAAVSYVHLLVAGLKRWALYPPHVKPPGLQQVQQLQQQQQQVQQPAQLTAAAAGQFSAASSSSSSSSWCTVTEAGSSSSKWSSSWDSSSSSGSDDHGDDSAGSGLTSLQVTLGRHCTRHRQSSKRNVVVVCWHIVPHTLQHCVEPCWRLQMLHRGAQATGRACSKTQCSIA